MTKEELLGGLEGLKELVNDGGKVQIEGLKAAVRELVSDAVSEEAAPAKRAKLFGRSE